MIGDIIIGTVGYGCAAICAVFGGGLFALSVHEHISRKPKSEIQDSIVSGFCYCGGAVLIAYLTRGLLG